MVACGVGRSTHGVRVHTAEMRLDGGGVISTHGVHVLTTETRQGRGGILMFCIEKKQTRRATYALVVCDARRMVTFSHRRMEVGGVLM